MIKQNPTREQRRREFLTNQHGKLRHAVLMWNGHMRDLYHPITNKDGTYWRKGKWNPPVKMQ